MNAPSLPQDEGAGDPPDDDVLAGELVLGLLGSADRRHAQERAEADREFSARVAGWERRLAPLLAEITPLAPPAQLWPQIRSRLGWQDGATVRPGLWQSLALWRSAAAIAALAALALWLSRTPVPPPPVAVVAPPAETAVAKEVTTLAHDDGSPGWLASVDPAHGTVLMVPVPGTADAQGRVPELWIIPPGGAPRSLGAVSITKSHTVAVPADSRSALVAAGSVLAVTLEPASGMPHAAPSGPIIAKGAIKT